MEETVSYRHASEDIPVPPKQAQYGIYIGLNSPKVILFGVRGS
jgi:hypothetical protein